MFSQDFFQKIESNPLLSRLPRTKSISSVLLKKLKSHIETCVLGVMILHLKLVMLICNQMNHNNSCLIVLIYKTIKSRLMHIKL